MTTSPTKCKMYAVQFLLAFAIAAISCCAEALALEAPKPGRDDARVRFVSYDPDEVVKVIGRARTSTQIIFAETEEIAHVAVGDTVAWEVAPALNILFLKPRELHPETNLQVVTVRANGQRRNYNFELRSIESGSHVYFTVKFRYPSDEAELARLKREHARKTEESKVIDKALKLHQQYGKRNFAYSAQGVRELQPDSVYDDGKVTVMRFEGNRPIPTIYMVRDDGRESLVPKDVRDNGRTIVIHTMASQFRLRAGRNVLCVYNELYDPVGENSGTGTTSPSIKRKIKE